MSFTMTSSSMSNGTHNGTPSASSYHSMNTDSRRHRQSDPFQEYARILFEHTRRQMDNSHIRLPSDSIPSQYSTNSAHKQTPMNTAAMD